tara:strand:- start:450 stop:725 length:276 start_codon:yes stop_codon:yes gene_type:complete
MSPRKKATSTQERLEKALKKATKEPKKEKASGVKKEVYKTKAKRGLGRNAEADEHQLQAIEKKHRKLKEEKAQTILLAMHEIDFLLELARE